MENDHDQYKKNRVFALPQIRLNDIQYRGSWSGKYVFDSICSGFIEGADSICAPEINNAQTDGIGFGVILLITVIIILVMIILLICYKRIVNKSLEASLNEKIQTQTIFSLGQYHVFKDDSTGRKTVDVSKL